MKKVNQAKGKTNVQAKNTPTPADSTTAYVSVPVGFVPASSVKSGNSDTLPALVEEQSKAARDLESYIAEFARKVDNLQTRPGDAELVILFVMNLQPRWKRLVEPLEPTFAKWMDAAQTARYHSAKMTALLGADDKDGKVVEEAGLAFFGTKESKKLLTSGYFVPDNHPRKADFADRDQPATTKDKLGNAFNATPEISTPTKTSKPRRQMNKNIGNDSDGASSKKNKAKAKKKSSASKQQQQRRNTGDEPQSTAHFHDLRNLLPDNIKELAFKEGTFNEFKQAQVYDQVPSEHMNVQLPFLKLKVSGQKVSALLAKNRWGASVMSRALLKRLNLLLEPEGGCDVATEFGLVTESVGSTILPLGHPSAPEVLLAPLEVQVLPTLYGGKVDLILGADFFFCFNASFTDVENRKIRFLNRETNFIVKELK